MAIVKAHFTRRRQEIKDILGYIIHRPGREEEKMSRVLFGRHGEIGKEEAYAILNSQKGSVYFHVILNFDQKREDLRKDLDLRAITRQTFAALEERLKRTIRFFAVEHNDHTDLRHIHAIAILKLARGQRVGREDWTACRMAATEAALLNRRGLDAVSRVHQASRYKLIDSQRILRQVAIFPGGSAKRGRHAHPPRPPRRDCPDCGMRQGMVRVKSGRDYCTSCGKVRERTQERSF